ncbi:hypothetical protein [Nostoc parmelioides]|uniref:Uncharacterized protein n=1 Tax=Nostoc parmelioides FACHB-3921 TaxID=2692909 RepID=A0ABR8BGU9_9NOSO|nr:hypothetical protein [Nostoc parmelioides]MBD2253322.1 hypothetical protein [Nostoc parmelioides FACHB-3921]
MSSDRFSDSGYANRFVINVLVVFSILVGLSPYFILVERDQLLSYLTLSVLIVPILSVKVKSFQTLRERVPRKIEFLLGGISSTFWSAIASFMGGMIYWLIIGVSNIARYILTQFSLDVQIEIELPAFYLSLLFVIVYEYRTIHFVTDLLVKQLYLYPQIVDNRSVSEQVAQLSIVGIFVFLIFAYIRLMGIYSTSWWFTFYSLLALIYISYRLARYNLLIPKILQERAIAAVEKLFEVSGYDVNSSFRTNDIGIDPLLTEVNFLARERNYSFAVEVMIASTAKITSETAIFSLLTASWTLTSFFQNEEERDKYSSYVKPLFIFVASKQFPSLKNLDNIVWLEEETDLQVITIDNWNKIKEILKLKNLEELQLKAREDFNIPRASNYNKRGYSIFVEEKILIGNINIIEAITEPFVERFAGKEAGTDGKGRSNKTEEDMK